MVVYYVAPIVLFLYHIFWIPRDTANRFQVALISAKLQLAASKNEISTHRGK